MNGASVFVASSVSGICFYSLQDANISIWECEGAPLEYLEEIALSEQEMELKLKQNI